MIKKNELNKLEIPFLSILRKLIPGGSAHSFGIHVAQMAGMPKGLILSAKKMFNNFNNQMNFFSSGIIADYDIFKSLVFAGVSLNEVVLKLNHPLMKS